MRRTRRHGKDERAPAREKWTRREFGAAGLMGAAAVSGHFFPLVGLPLIQESKPRKKSEPALAPPLGEILRCAADELVPAADGMPAASAVGTLEYLDGVFRGSPEIVREFQSGLPAIESISRQRFQKGFVALTGEQRARVLSELEKSDPAFFGTLRDFVYEGYYLQPRVWKLIGYGFYPTQAPVPAIRPFDEAVLAKAAKRPKLYRQVG